MACDSENHCYTAEIYHFKPKPLQRDLRLCKGVLEGKETTIFKAFNILSGAGEEDSSGCNKGKFLATQ